ncbi:serine/threonine-protein kinase VRK1-like isoform X2 [Haemaphysalis longicornis]
MPKRASPNPSDPPRKRAAAAGKKAAAAPRKAANGHRLPDPLPAGEILTDLCRKQWRLGKAVGLGGFGEIYLASDVVSKPVDANAAFVVKIEPHSNGPLFTEINFYHRVGKAEQINQWVKERKLDYLGMPQFRGSGSHDYNGEKYRFLVMDRFGEDLQKVLNRSGKTIPLKAAFTLGMRVIDVLEYVHSLGYIHADVKASNLLLGFGKGNENKVYLVDFGLACRYMTNGVHKEYKEDLRKAHDGTIEFTSRDAHIGAHSRRGDIEILGYNLLQWLCCRLPWEENLKDPEYVSQQKCGFMDNIPLLMTKCFPHGDVPSGIQEFLRYVASMKFEDTPDYKRLRRILEQGIQAAGLKADGRLQFTPPKVSRRNSFSPKKKPAEDPVLAEDSMEESGEENHVPEKVAAGAGRARVAAVRRTNRRSPAADKPPAEKKPMEEVVLVEQSAGESSSDEGSSVPEKVAAAAKGGRRRVAAVRKNSRRSPPALPDKPSPEIDGLLALDSEPKPARKRAASALSTARTSSRADSSRKNGFSEDSNSMGLDNPTPAMLEVLQRKQALLAQQQQEGLLPSGGGSGGGGGGSGRKRSSTSPPASSPTSPWFNNGFYQSPSPVPTCDRGVQASPANAPRSRSNKSAKPPSLRSTASQTEP